MSDLNSHNVPLGGQGLAGKVQGPVRRVLVRLLRPVFERQAVLLAEVHARADGHDDDLETLRRRVEHINAKADVLCAKIDRVSERLDRLSAAFEALSARQDGQAADLAAVVALNWDHVALANRLGQLEDRLCGQDEAAEGLASISFPGLERFQPDGRAAASGLGDVEPPPRTQAG